MATQLTVSQRGQDVIASPIRKFLPLMQSRMKQGIKVYSLSSGDPDIPVPEDFFARLSTFNDPNLHYAPSSGFSDHVAAWLKYYQAYGVQLEPKHLIPTIGCAEAILLAMISVADIGDDFLVFEPLYVSYKAFARMIGVKLIPITLKNDSQFTLPDAASIAAKITPKTKAIIIINPDNPTGKLWTEVELNTVISLAKAHNLFVIADETYREIRFQGDPTTLLSHQDAKEHIILVDSTSKRFSMPGARIGCIASFNEAVMAVVLKLAQARLSAGTLEQYALIPLLENASRYTAPIKAEYHQRRDIVYSALNAIPGVVASKPEGAFYVFASLPIASAEHFVTYLVRDFAYEGETILLAPMADFYLTPGLGQNEIRIAYVLNQQDLAKAMTILRKGLEEYRKHYA